MRYLSESDKIPIEFVSQYIVVGASHQMSGA